MRSPALASRVAPPRPLRLALAVALVSCLAAAPAAAAPAPPSFFGVAPQSKLEDPDYQLLVEDRVGTVRQLFLWPMIEPRRGEYSWGPIDDVVRRASEAGIDVFPVLYGVPEWAQSPHLHARCGITCAPAGPEARQGFARFAAAAVARYGPGGSFWTAPPPPPEPPPPGPVPDPCVPPLLCRAAQGGGPIEVWQVWNEQNSPKYHGPKVNVRRYAALVKQASAAIRGQDPQAEIVLGGMWGPPEARSVVLPTMRYLKRLYNVRGARSTFDSIAVHPYAGRLRSVKTQVRGIRKLLRRVGDRRAGLWVTELGWASGGRRSEPLVKTRKQQARLLRRAYRLLMRKRLAWRIRSVHWYSWRDTDLNAGICAWCPRSGLRTQDGAPKPAANSFRQLPRSS